MSDTRQAPTRIVFACSPDSHEPPRAIGPVASGDPNEKLRDEITAAGWVILGNAVPMSAVAFRAEVKRDQPPASRRRSSRKADR
jgi:hypothetical protein